MARTGMSIIALLAAGVALASSGEAQSEEYIVMGTPLVNIRTGPTMENAVVGRAEKGDVFTVTAAEGDWIEIEMFTSDHRYVHAASYVYPLSIDQLVPGHRMSLPESASTLQDVYRHIASARQRAQTEADEILPEAVDAERHGHLLRILEDRMILEVMHADGIQPALYADLVGRAESTE